MILRLLNEHHLEFLNLKGGCTGLSESTLHKMPQLLEITCHRSFVCNYMYAPYRWNMVFGINRLTLVLLNLAPENIKLFPCSSQLSTKFILFINVKMPTTVGILTSISMINTTSERLKARNFFICWYFSFYEQLKFHADLFM